MSASAHSVAAARAEMSLVRDAHTNRVRVVPKLRTSHPFHLSTLISHVYVRLFARKRVQLVFLCASVFLLELLCELPSTSGREFVSMAVGGAPNERFAGR